MYALWQKRNTNILVEELPLKKKQTHYMCESCFKEFKTQNSDSIKEYFEKDLPELLTV